MHAKSFTNGKFAATLSVLFGLSATAATIEWEEARNIGADADVSTEGELVFAYNENNADATINGVLFVGVNRSTTHFPHNDAIERDVSLGNVNDARINLFCENFTSTETLSAAYENLLDGAAFNTTVGSSATVTLQGLRAGEDYLVQVWINDNRSVAGNRTTTLDGVCQVGHHPEGASYGQYAIGRFKADSAGQTITLASDTNPQINAIQLRWLPSTTWGEVQNIGDGSEIMHAGATLCAYNFDKNNHKTYTVNGVDFLYGGDDGTAMSANLELIVGGGETLTVSSASASFGQYINGWPDDVPDDYTRLLGKGVLSVQKTSSPSWLDITIKNLVPGRKYAAQLWYNDARSTDAMCAIYQKIDGVRSLYAYGYDSANNKTNAGQTVVGEFIATSVTKTIRVRGYNTNVRTKNNPSITAIQVRDITEDFWCERADANFLTEDSDVRTDGTLVYAYTAHDQDATVNNVTFTSQSSYSAWGDDVTMTGFSERRTRTFISSPSGHFERLLSSGVLAKNTGGGETEATLTFANLEAGKPHLIQLFVSDSRSTVDGLGSCGFKVAGLMDGYAYYQNASTDKRYGSSVSLVIWPSSSAATLKLVYNNAAKGALLNSLQVRKLDPADHPIDRTLDPCTERRIDKTDPGRTTLGASPNLRYATVTAGTLVFGANASTVSLDGLNVYSPGTVELTAGASVAVAAASFDLSAISAVRIPDGFSLTPGNCRVLTTTGTFTGNLPPIVSSAKNLHLEIENLAGGGQALRLRQWGLTIIFR